MVETEDGGVGPPVTMVMAWAAFGDRLQLMDVVGLIVVAVGVLLTQVTLRDTSRTHREHEKTTV